MRYTNIFKNLNYESLAGLFLIITFPLEKNLSH